MTKENKNEKDKKEKIKRKRKKEKTEFENFQLASNKLIMIINLLISKTNDNFKKIEIENKKNKINKLNKQTMFMREILNPQKGKDEIELPNSFFTSPDSFPFIFNSLNENNQLNENEI